jgi:Rieske Fe-S protein
MLLICRTDIDREAFDRLEQLAAAVPHPVRWTRRAGRLVLQVRGAAPDAPGLDELRGDPGVEWVLADPSPEESGRMFSRRELLDVALVSTGVISAGCLLGPGALFLAPPEGGRGTHGDVLVARVASVPVGGAVARVVDGEDLIVIRRDEQRFVALSATCTHSEACLVEWDRDRRQLRCPCHRGVFDLYGNVVSGPPPRPLGMREAIVRDGAVFVRRRPA